MPDQPGLTDEQEALLRMIREAGPSATPAAALFARLESLEAAVAEWEEHCAAHPQAAADEPAPDAPGAPERAAVPEAPVGSAGSE